jgi:hypothetical protein
MKKLRRKKRIIHSKNRIMTKIKEVSKEARMSSLSTSSNL